MPFTIAYIIPSLAFSSGILDQHKKGYGYSLLVQISITDLLKH